MELLCTLLISVAMFALLIVPGLVLGRMKLIERTALSSITNILMYLAMPALVLSKLLCMDGGELSVVDVVVCAAAPAVAVAVGFLVAKLVFGRKGGDTRWRIGRYCSIFSNCGFLGIPLAAALCPDRPQVAVGVSVFNVVSTFLLLTFGVYVLSDDRKHIRLRRAAISPIAIAILLGVVLLSLGVNQTSAGKVIEYVGYLAALTTPLSMLVLGVEFSSLRVTRMITSPGLYLCAAIKLVLVPLFVMLLAALLGACGLEISREARLAVFLATAVSTAATAPAMSKKYGADSEHAAILTLGTTLLCVLTLPALYALLTYFSIL